LATNNTGGNSGAGNREGVGADVAELRKDFSRREDFLLLPSSRVAGVLGSNRIKNEAANKIIAKLDDGKHVFFMNINDSP